MGRVILDPGVPLCIARVSERHGKEVSGGSARVMRRQPRPHVEYLPYHDLKTCGGLPDISFSNTAPKRSTCVLLQICWLWHQGGLMASMGCEIYNCSFDGSGDFATGRCILWKVQAHWIRCCNQAFSIFIESELFQTE